MLEMHEKWLSTDTWKVQKMTGCWHLKVAKNYCGWRCLKGVKNDCGCWRLEGTQKNCGCWCLKGMKNDCGCWHLKGMKNDCGCWHLKGMKNDCGCWHLKGMKNDCGCWHLKGMKNDCGCWHYVPSSLYQWCHEQGLDVQQKYQMRHKPAFFCSSLVKSKPTELCSEEVTIKEKGAAVAY